MRSALIELAGCVPWKLKVTLLQILLVTTDKIWKPRHQVGQDPCDNVVKSGLPNLPGDPNKLVGFILQTSSVSHLKFEGNSVVLWRSRLMDVRSCDMEILEGTTEE
jgi:hypothetical protein